MPLLTSQASSGRSGPKSSRTALDPDAYCTIARPVTKYSSALASSAVVPSPEHMLSRSVRAGQRLRRESDRDEKATATS